MNVANTNSDSESQIAILSEGLELENERSVSSKPGLHTAKRYSKVSPCDSDKSNITSVFGVSTPSASSVGSYDENESPLFVRSQKVKFVDLQCVASSSVSNTPLQNIMNTPKFQLRKLQQQLIEDRESRDGLEKELAQKLELLAQRESQINRMQYILDKLKKDQSVTEQIAKEQIEELENKNNQLQSRFNDVLKQNKDLKSDTALMERQVGRLAEENGELSTQMRNVCAELANSQAEVGRLTESQTLNEEEWRRTTSNLQFELNDARAKKGDLLEQIEILKGRILCLEEQLSSSTQQEEGDNMWISVEKVMLEKKIGALTDEVESKTNSLQKIEVEVLAKTQQIKECEKEISVHKELLIQQQNKEVELIQSKNDTVENLQKEMSEVREVLQQEIVTLKLSLEKAEEEKCEQTKRLQVQLASYAEEIEKLKEVKQQKEEILFQTEEKIRDLMAKLSAANNLLADKDKEVCRLAEKVDSLVVMHQQAKAETQAKNEMFSKLLAEKSKEEEVLQSNIQLLKDQVNSLQTSLKEAEESLLMEKDLLSKTHQEKCEQIEMLNRDFVVRQKTIETLKHDIEVKDNQLIEMKNENMKLAEGLQEEIHALQGQISGLCESLTEAKQQLQAQKTELTKREEERSRQKELLQQQLSSSEEMVNNLKEQIKTKTDQMSLLEKQSLENSEFLNTKINNLQEQLTSLKTDLTKAQEDLCLKENNFALKLQEIDEQKIKVFQFKDEVTTLRVNLQSKEEAFCQLKRKTSTEIDHLKAENLKQSQVLENEIQCLRSQVHSLQESLNNAKQQLHIKEEMLARKEMDISCEKDLIQNLKTTLEDEINALKQQIHNTEEQMVTLKNNSEIQSNLHQQEKLSLKDQLDDMADSLSKAEEQVKTHLQTLTEHELKTAQEQQLLQQKHEAFQAMIGKLEDEIRNKDHQMAELKTHGLEQSKVLMEQNECLQRQLESLASSLKDTDDKMQLKESLLNQQKQENKQKQQEVCDLRVEMEQVVRQMSSFKQENNTLQVDLREKDALLEKSQQQCQVTEQELSAIKIKMYENNEKLLKLEEDAVAHAELIHKAKGEVQIKDRMLNEVKEESSRKITTLQQCVESLKSQLEDCSQKLAAKEEQLLKIQLESSQQIDVLNQELVSLNTEMNKHQELHSQDLRKNEEMLDSTKKERDDLFKEKETLNSRIVAAEKQLEDIVFENQRLAQVNQALERENSAAQSLHTKLHQDLQMLKQDRGDLLKEKKKMEDFEMVKKDLLEQLSAKSTAAEHYKTQMEKAVSHYNGKKQLLQQSEEEAANLKQSLEVQERAAKTATMENQILQMELDKIQSNERLLLDKIASLEAQLSFADKVLREQNKIQYHDRTSSQSMPSSLDGPSQQYRMHTRTKVKSMSSDSLDQSSADDSLNNTRKLCAPGESSTPLVRSSERLAAKRRGLEAESLETLYFTPINTRHRVKTDFRPEESTKKNSASSIKRRRTTQVINITMTKKTPGSNEADDTFYSLTSARSHPNLSSAHKAQGISTELFATPAKATGLEADQLIGLPGYRRSTIHSQATSTFCVGAENEPEGGPEDWMRIAEIQARNKACLPHLKSSYPLEAETARNSALMFTDEELRTGDPIETIRRASLMPGQLQDSLASHRLSYMVGPSGAAATARSRLSLMPGQDIPKVVNNTFRSPKGSKRAPSTLTIHPTSPEKKVRASCFPRPLTPKNKNVVSGPTLPHVQSPVDRRQSMMFTIDNTPKKDLLKKGLSGLSKLRSSTRKSPGKSVKKSPAQPSSRRGQENIPTTNGRAAVGGAGRLRSQKSPMVTQKGQKKSPKVSARAMKSPGLTASARKMMRRMKV